MLITSDWNDNGKPEIIDAATININSSIYQPLVLLFRDYYYPHKSGAKMNVREFIESLADDEFVPKILNRYLTLCRTYSSAHVGLVSCTKLSGGELLVDGFMFASIHDSVAHITDFHTAINSSDSNIEDVERKNIASNCAQKLIRELCQRGGIEIITIKPSSQYPTDYELINSLGFTRVNGENELYQNSAAAFLQEPLTEEKQL